MNMSAQAFGDDLRQYLDQYPRARLAKKMFSDGRFAPQGIDSPDDLERLVQATETGGHWPYHGTDLTDFVEVLVACGPDRNPKQQLTLKYSGANYSTELGP
jgi:hypothetical protein